MRTLVDIPDRQIKALSELCKEKKVSRAELIRRAVNDYIARNLQEEVDAFGLWRKNDEIVDGMIYQERLRDEW